MILELQNICKSYGEGRFAVPILHDICFQVEKGEYVAVMGPSGSGKSTLMNIIGCLDVPTSGNFLLDGREIGSCSQDELSEIRNKTIGFVFQNFNLLPRETALENVALPMLYGKVKRKERLERAAKALESVGLSDRMNFYPTQLSGGQKQRVAIARAMVMKPLILLADEPTGALDTETSLQVMDILKEISKDRLVVMVTHNPDLAEQYATRTVRMLDGVIQSDSMPLTEAEQAELQKEAPEKGKKQPKTRKPSMSFFTSFTLSLKNLFTKRGRTVLTSFAGSIGIIGIALIYAVSQGMTTYIDLVQEETLSSYPLTLEATHMDLGSLMETFMGNAQSGEEHELDAVYQKAMIYDMINTLNTAEVEENDLTAFKKFLEAQRADENDPYGLHQAVSGVQYTYDLDLQVYTKNVDGKVIRSDTQALMQEILLENFGLDLTNLMGLGEQSGGMMGAMQSMSSMSPMGASMNLWQEMLPGDNGKIISPLVEKQYELEFGSWPNSYDEVVLVMDKNNELDDLTLYALGLRSKEEIDKIVDAAFSAEQVEVDNRSWSYQEICGLEFRTVLASDCYHLDETTGLYTDLRNTDAGLTYLYNNGLKLKVTGIIRPKEDVLSPMLSGSIAYTSLLTEHVVLSAKDSPALQAQKADPTRDIFTGLPFRDEGGTLTEEYKEKAFKEHVAGLTVSEKAAAYVKISSIPAQEQVDAAVSQTVGSMTREQMQQMMIQALSTQMSMSEQELTEYLDAMPDEDFMEMFSMLIAEQYRMQYAAQVAASLKPMPEEQLAGLLEAQMVAYTQQQCAQYYEEVLEFSETSYESNLVSLGDVDLDSPASINLYAASFEDKDVIEDAIAAYNEKVDEFERIAYTDYVGLIMSSVTTIINAITYVLIAFVAVSLIVSSIMIGVITLISVQERTKEIGILRAIGASKKNVSSMFNAETVIIGFTSGLLGVVVTYLLCIPINAILNYLTGIANLRAILPGSVALILIGISMLLTLISGIIPSRSAAKKDPVVALRSE